MNILFLLIPLSLLLLSFAVWAFFWAVKNDQFDDLEGPAYSILFDDEDEQPANREKHPEPEQQKQSGAHRENAATDPSAPSSARQTDRQPDP